MPCIYLDNPQLYFQRNTLKYEESFHTSLHCNKKSKWCEETLYKEDLFPIEFSDNEIDELLDKLTSLLANIGLDVNQEEPNETGLIIESIIEVLAAIKYS